MDLRTDRWAVNAWMTMPLSEREKYVPERLQLVNQLITEGVPKTQAHASAGFQLERDGTVTEMSGRYPWGAWYARDGDNSEVEKDAQESYWDG